jgi:hypothetical protein
MEIINPAVWNYIQYLYQWNMYNDETRRDEYLALSPEDIFADWSFDGVVESEIMSSGKESTNYSGFTQVNGLATRNPCESKLLTMGARGMEFIYNYFGDNIKPGAEVYAIIKKHKVPLDYTLTGKRVLPASQLLSEKETSVPNYSPFKPYQMSFISLPRGGNMPSKHLEYVDEAGFTRYDAKAIYLGKVFSVPVDHKYRDVEDDLKPFTRTSVSSGKAFTDARVGTGNDRTYILMRLIFNTDNGYGL